MKLIAICSGCGYAAPVDQHSAFICLVCGARQATAFDHTHHLYVITLARMLVERPLRVAVILDHLATDGIAYELADTATNNSVKPDDIEDNLRLITILKEQHRDYQENNKRNAPQPEIQG